VHVKSAGVWVLQLARTIKTGRLYDSGNPTYRGFRDELWAALSTLLKTHGPLTLRFTTNDVLLGDFSLYPARSREDNLALPFFRDGIRSLTFAPGIELQELSTLLDLLLRATARGSDDEDLVSLLWNAQLAHLDMKYISTVADTEGSDGEESGLEASPNAAPLAWPATAQSTACDASAGSPAGGSAPPEEPQSSDHMIRSDDWLAGSPAGEIETALLELEARSTSEVERFRTEYRAEHETASVAISLALIRDCIDTACDPGDFVDLSNFVPRLLHESLAGGLWREAREALLQLRRCPGSAWSPERLLEDLAQPGSVATGAVVAHLDHRGLQGVEEFLAITSDLGPASLDWLVRIMSESQQQRTRRRLVKAIAELCRDNPERLAPWISDERWYVVRNVAHVLGVIGGNDVVGLLRASTRHPELRVRIEVIGALAEADAEISRPLLLEMLEGAETRIFCAVLHQLAAGRDREVTLRLLDLLEATGFDRRPIEEKRAVYLGLAAPRMTKPCPDSRPSCSTVDGFPRGTILTVSRSRAASPGSARPPRASCWSGVPDRGTAP
jgi:hypothetical protein